MARRVVWLVSLWRIYIVLEFWESNGGYCGVALANVVGKWLGGFTSGFLLES